MSRLLDLEGGKPRGKKFDTYPIGFFHIDTAVPELNSYLRAEPKEP